MTTMHTGNIKLSLSPRHFTLVSHNTHRVVLAVLQRHRDRPELLGKALHTLASIASTSEHSYVCTTLCVGVYMYMYICVNNVYVCVLKPIASLSLSLSPLQP